MKTLASVLCVALACAPALAEPEAPRPANEETRSSEPVALPESFRGTWRIDNDATLALYADAPGARRQEIAKALAYIDRFDIVLTKDAYDSIPSILGRSIPLTVEEAREDTARIAIESPDMGRIEYTLTLLPEDRLKLANTGEGQIDVICARVDAEEIIEGDPVEFLTGAWEIDRERLEALAAQLSEASRTRLLETLGNFRIDVTPDSFSDVRGYELEKLAPNRYNVNANGRTFFHVNIDGPDAITLVSGREYPMKRVSPDTGGPDPDSTAP